METNVVLRAVASVLIVGTHAGVFALQGGAHLFLAVAGFNFARFRVPTSGTIPARRHAASIARIAVPSVLWLTALFLASVEVFGLPKLLLVNDYAGTGLWEYWFVEVIVQTLLVFALALSVPSVRSLERRWPVGFAFALLGAALAIRFDVLGVLGAGLGRHPMYRTDTLLWLFLVGWVAQRAASRWHRLLLSTLIVLAVPGFFDKEGRANLVLAGLLVLVWCARVPVPSRLIRPVSVLAAASLWIYLTQFAVLRALVDTPPLVAASVALAVGIGTWLAGRAFVTWWRGARARKRSPRRPGQAPSVAIERALVS
jgi:hypothetical protein